MDNMENLWEYLKRKGTKRGPYYIICFILLKLRVLKLRGKYFEQEIFG
ncbi:hypothetical protein [Oxobacter pfennigii]|nr:hypothetical protein [Oxobacter pfennigii]